jgi:hypothetical protein
VLQQKRLKMAKEWAKTWKRATSGENGKASPNVTRPRTLPRVIAKTPEKGFLMGENVETGDVGRKLANFS